MSTLIVAGLMVFGLLAIVAAVLLAMGENKTSPTSTTPSITESPAEATVRPTADFAPALVAEQHLSVMKGEAQTVAITTQFSELIAQLRALHEQTREIEQRLSILSDIAESIERSQFSISIEEAENYRLLEPANDAPVS
jgi:hypothetical protein